MASFRWTTQRMDQLERAIRDRRRVIVERRGTEYVVTARRLRAGARGDVFIGFLPMTGEELEFVLDELDGFQVVDG